MALRYLIIKNLLSYQLQVNHKDENRLNNMADNLEWCTQLYNNHYGTHSEKTISGRTKQCKGYKWKYLNN